MAGWKQHLLGPYYHATLPWRCWRNLQAGRAGRAPVMIVYYHRIADDSANSWTLSFAHFRRHKDWLQRHFALVSLQEARARVAAMTNFRPCVSITFDDGYAENCERALPLLIERRIPCTCFVTTQNVLTGQPFPHDVAGGHRFAPNTAAQLRELANAGIEIGAHSRTHADLGAIQNPEQLYDELVLAARDLQTAIERPVRYFAFPFGMHRNLQPLAFTLAREMFQSVCSAYGGYNYPGDDPFHLQRIGGEGPLVRLKNWLTVDPLKEHRIVRYACDAPHSGLPHLTANIDVTESVA